MQSGETCLGGFSHQMTDYYITDKRIFSVLNRTRLAFVCGFFGGAAVWLTLVVLVGSVPFVNLYALILLIYVLVVGSVMYGGLKPPGAERRPFGEVVQRHKVFELGWSQVNTIQLTDSTKHWYNLPSVSVREAMGKERKFVVLKQEWSSVRQVVGGLMTASASPH